MEWWSLLKRDLFLLILLGVANSSPILARVVLKERLSYPLDMGFCLWDKRRIFGDHKTMRGILASLLITPCFSYLFGMGATLGLRLALLSMAGDLFSSFIKRRMGLRSGMRATGLDQIPEALIPLFFLSRELHLGYVEIFCLVALFFVLELSISPLLYAMRIRRAPY